MRIRVQHDTSYAYERSARSILQHLRLTPRSHDGQHVIRWMVDPSATGRLRAGEDRLGNILHVFEAEAAVAELRIRVTGEVETLDTAGIVRGAVERAPDPYYLRETPLTAPDAALRDFAARFAGPGDALGRLHDLLGTVHREMRFEVASTGTGTTAAEAFAAGRGVCQDLAHIFLSTARLLDIPCRYVSGYFWRADGIVQQEAGHAWVEAKTPGLGWVGFDPANGISVSEAHVRVAVGLDYLGASPVRGSRIGGGGEALTVRLSVGGGAVQRQSQG